MKEFDVCRQLEDLLCDIGSEYHGKKCPIYIYRKKRHPLDDVECNCHIGKHEEKILILKSKIESALELFGITPDTTMVKYFGEE